MDIGALAWTPRPIEVVCLAFHAGREPCREGPPPTVLYVCTVCMYGYVGMYVHVDMYILAMAQPVHV